MKTNIEEEIKQLEARLAELKEQEKEKNGGLYIKQPEFENAFFFVEDGRVCVKRRPKEPRRCVSVRIAGAPFVCTNPGFRIGIGSVLDPEFDVDEVELCLQELIKWIREERIKENADPVFGEEQTLDAMGFSNEDKRKTFIRLSDYRVRNGFGFLAVVAKASNGVVTEDEMRDMITGKVYPLSKWKALDEALDLVDMEETKND